MVNNTDIQITRKRAFEKYTQMQELNFDKTIIEVYDQNNYTNINSHKPFKEAQIL